MPVYTYRREDGTTFDFRQKFLDDPLTVDPETGQHVVRVIQPAGVIFKGSGFYVNDSKNASRAAVTSTPKHETEKAEKPAAASTVSQPAAAAPAATGSQPAAAPATAAAAD